jgi:guanylate kinase
MKIVYIIGPSGSGKDMVFGRLREFFMDSLNPIVMYTNRPMRPGEIDGKTYHYRLLDELKELDEKGLIIEKREYNTIHGLWIYATVDDGSFTEDKNYIGIGTLESLSDLQKYFGADKIIPLFVYVMMIIEL